MTVTGTLFAEPEGRWVEVAVPVPLRRRFTYRVDEPLAARLSPGCRVAVPFGRRKLPGFVLGFCDEAPEGVQKVRRTHRSSD